MRPSGGPVPQSYQGFRNKVSGWIGAEASTGARRLIIEGFGQERFFAHTLVWKNVPLWGVSLAQQMLLLELCFAGAAAEMERHGRSLFSSLRALDD